MRHGKKFNHLSRTASHRKAMLSNMATSLIVNKRITTTVAKAKALRKYIEPLITKAKVDDTNSRRVVFSYLQDKSSVQELFGEVADKVASRPGGYTRIIKTETRLGDNADMCIIELVDYNELLLKDSEPQKTKTRRSRRGGKSKKAEETKVVEAVSEEKKPAEAQAVDTGTEVKEDVVEESNDETSTEEVQAQAETETEDKEAPKAESGTEGAEKEEDDSEEKKD
jgi:large subunit ribosomal protein L17